MEEQKTKKQDQISNKDLLEMYDKTREFIAFLDKELEENKKQQ